jgi:hypothetical protein
VAGRWWRFTWVVLACADVLQRAGGHTHAMFQDVEPHISGVVSVVLRARKELIPKGTEQ